MLERLARREQTRMYPAALVCCTLANLLADREQHPEPFTMQDFLGGGSSADEEMLEFVDKVQRGEKFEPPPPEVMEEFKKRIEGKV